MANIARWDPFAEMENFFAPFRSRASRMFPRLSGDGGISVEWSPSADISETDKEYLIRAELPAVKKEDVKVTVDEGMITIEGERKQQQEDKNERMHRVESFYGHFTRSFSLPESIDENAIRCESKDGVLTAHIPKVQTPKQQPKQIKVD